MPLETLYDTFVSGLSLLHILIAGIVLLVALAVCVWGIGIMLYVTPLILKMVGASIYGSFLLVLDWRERSMKAKHLNKLWNVGAKQARYHKDGISYDCLDKFPGALFDQYGYVLFETAYDYRWCPKLRHGTRLTIDGEYLPFYGRHDIGHLSEVHGYVKMSAKPLGSDGPCVNQS